jgi:drug/metabolite transporter (DMT)-like permease
MRDTLPQNRLVSAWLGLPGNLRGVIWITVGSLAFACNDGVIKHLGAKFDPFQLAFARYFVGLVILGPVFISMGASGLSTQRFGLHMTRLIIACIAQVGVFYAVIHLYLADATAITFSRPLFTTIIAVFLLSELVSVRRWIATIVGFAGVMIMVRPGHAGIDPVALIAIVSALTFAVANVLIRMLSNTEPPNRILFYYHTGGTVIFLGPAIWVWQTPVGAEWFMLALIGMLTTIGMIGFVRAFSVGEANAVGPIEYIRLIFAAFIGYAFFAEIPSLWTIVGAIVIIASALYIARDEAKRPATPLPETTA